MRGLEGKKAIVTGGAQGIGRAIVERFLEHGVAVAFSDLEDTGGATEKELRDAGHDVHWIQGDMIEESFCRETVRFAVERLGGVDYLVNNAFSFIAAGMDAKREQWLRSMNVGPIGYATMIQHAAPEMAKRGGGAIVNIASISAHIAQPGRWTYNAAKGAVLQITRCAALDLAPQGIRVNTVSPGWIWTREVLKAAGGDRDTYGPVWGKYHMLRRLADASEVAAPVVFLCSDDASFVTGSELPVDGGYLGLGGEGLGEASEFAGSE